MFKCLKVVFKMVLSAHDATHRALYKWHYFIFINFILPDLNKVWYKDLNYKSWAIWTNLIPCYVCNQHILLTIIERILLWCSECWCSTIWQNIFISFSYYIDSISLFALSVKFGICRQLYDFFCKFKKDFG